MPALDQKTIDDLTDRLWRFLTATGGADEVQFLDAGGSAAVFRVRRGADVRAVKGFDPALFDGPGGAADRRRLEVQRRLVGHACPSLIQTYRVDESEGTAFIEMEFIDWPQLARRLPDVPDDAIVPLIGQLVDAVRFLEGLNIVHRDIKPENIHVSSDFKNLKLLDLGVAREFESSHENDAAVTDSGIRRPFLATAQYSSPDYLFRLDEPTAKLWRGLNFYQVGAVLHDLIKKEALFQHEIGLGNRWLVARAVLTKQPSFADAALNRLPALKALAVRCLTKDLDTRLALVGWEDFLLEGATDPLAALRGRLSKGLASLGGQAGETTAARLAFERSDYLRRLAERVRAELIGICGTSLPLMMRLPAPGEPLELKFLFSPNRSVSIECIANFKWHEEMFERNANVNVGAYILCTGEHDVPSSIEFKPVAVVAIQANDDEAVVQLATEIARRVGIGLDRIEAAGEAISSLHATSLE
jgi:serine/threonine-protein kinase